MGRFLGSYIGAIIGALVSLIGIAATIKYTNEQNRIDRELQVRPYCTIRHVHDDKLVGTNRIIGSIPIGCEPQENNGPCYTSILYVKISDSERLSNLNSAVTKLMMVEIII